MRVLIADDDELSLLVLAEMVAMVDAAAEVETARDGAEALRALGRSCFDLVLSDVEMPGLTGVEFVRRVRTELEDPVPIVCVTAHAVVGDRERLLMLGFDDYLAKPYDAAALRRVLDRFATRS